MLIFERFAGQMVDLTLPSGEVIVIQILARNNHGGSMRIGIDAPRNVLVDRREITLRKAREVAIT